MLLAIVSMMMEYTTTVSCRFVSLGNIYKVYYSVLSSRAYYITNIIKTIRLSKLLLDQLPSFNDISNVVCHYCGQRFLQPFNSRYQQCRQSAYCIQLSLTVWPLTGLVALKWLNVSQIHLLLIKLSNNSYQPMTEMDVIYLCFIILYFVEILGFMKCSSLQEHKTDVTLTEIDDVMLMCMIRFFI